MCIKSFGFSVNRSPQRQNVTRYPRLHVNLWFLKKVRCCVGDEVKHDNLASNEFIHSVFIKI